MIRELTCIVCPKGCQMRVELEGGEIREITGFTCPRGKQYAIDECTHPMRTITTTVRAESGEIIPVKTNRTVPKELMFDCMKAINAVEAKLPVRIGDAIIENLLGTGADVVATANID